MKRTNTAVWMEKYNRWQINVQKDGVRRTFTCATKGREGQRTCNAKADSWLDEGLVNQQLRTAVLFDTWIEELKITTSRSHWGQYEGYGKLYIKPKIGHIKISALNEQHLQNVITYMYSKGLSKKTLCNARSCMTAFVKYARKGKATTLVVENVSIPTGAKVGERNILQPSDIVKLFECDNTIVRGKECYELFVQAYRFEVVTGMRPGEVKGLQNNDVCGDIVSIRRSINIREEVTRGKNDNARRSFTLTKLAKQILYNQKVKLAELGIVSEYVFPNSAGECIAYNAYYKRWVRYCEVNGITPISTYELRHTFVSAVKNLPEGYLKPLIGHSKDMDTYGTYSHELDGDMATTAVLVQSVFDKLLKNNTNEKQ